MREISKINQNPVRKRHLKSRLLGRQLIKAGLITQTQLSTAINEQKVSKKSLEQILVSWNWVKPQEIERLLEQVVWLEQQIVNKKLSHQTKNRQLKQAAVNRAKQAAKVQLYPLVASAHQVEFNLSPQQTLRFLLFIVVSLALIGFLSRLPLYFLPDYPSRDLLASLFNLNGEQNIPALYSTSALLFCAALLAAIAHITKVAKERYVIHWITLSVIFLFLSFDELTGVHEQFMSPVSSALNTSSFLLFAWVIPYTIFVLISFLAFLRFLTVLPARIRNLFIMAGVFLVGGAVGMELLEGYQMQLHGIHNLTMEVLIAIEEFLEMLGIVVFSYALLLYISSYMKGLVLQVGLISDKMQRQSHLNIL